MRDAVELEGMTLKEACEKWGVNENTARNWVRYRERVARVQRYVDIEEDQ